jgi:hypothetical protein
MMVGNDTAALADFDEYSREDPQAALGLYGRGLVQLRNGEASDHSNVDASIPIRTLRSNASILAAERLNPNVADLWAREFRFPPSPGNPQIFNPKSTARIPTEE